MNDLTKISAGAPLGVFTIEFRKPGTLNDLYSATTAIAPVGAGSAFGKFTLTGVPLGTYDVAVKGPKNLRVSLSGVSVGAVSALPNFTLPAGDCNGDNAVDPTDFATFISAYNSDFNLPGNRLRPDRRLQTSTAWLTPPTSACSSANTTTWERTKGNDE